MSPPRWVVRCITKKEEEIMEDNRRVPELSCARPKNWKLDRMGKPPTPEKIEKQRPEDEDRPREA
jgi:hypothetical protein